MLKMAGHVQRQTGLRNLVMAGGVALNSVANGRIIRETPFEQVYIQPNAGDAGGALGAALYVWHALLGQPRRFVMEHAYYGESYSDAQIQRFLREQNIPYHYIEDQTRLTGHVVDALQQGQVIGLFQGRFEWGPRALGNRSILADPRRAEMKEIVNTKIKFREPFRPFAPVVTAEAATHYFDLPQVNQYPPRCMLMVAPVCSDRENEIPAVSHRGTGRLQTIRPEWNPFYHDLVQQFGQATGTPVLLNTSFNLRSEPIVSSPTEAFNTFSRSDLDMLVLGRFVVSKESSNSQLGKYGVGLPVADQVTTPAARLVPERLFSQLICPVCHGPILPANGTGQAVNCAQCNRRFPVENGIPLLYWPTEETNLDSVTDIVKQFYEANPFPGYQETDTAQRLVEKARQSIFAKMLDDQIPPQASILEVGCGTGQLSNFLGVSGRTVYGADLCLNSLKLGRQFSLSNALDRVHFVQMNLYKPVFPAESFDYVLCNGALPAVHDPFGGFRSIGRLVRPGGYIVVGLYNWYGRLWNDMRRVLFNLTGDRFLFLDSHLARADLDDEKKRIWFMDQYKHPQEIKHTIDEVLEWFNQTGFEFVNGLPKVTPMSRFSEFESLFDKNPRGSRLDHLLAQWQQILAGGPEGGFFVMIGQKKQD